MRRGGGGLASVYRCVAPVIPAASESRASGGRAWPALPPSSNRAGLEHLSQFRANALCAGI
jgi:hypothetical protein